MVNWVDSKIKKSANMDKFKLFLPVSVKNWFKLFKAIF
jgi:hypothetical protein